MTSSLATLSPDPSARLPARFDIHRSNIDTAWRYDAVLRLLDERWKPGMRLLEVGSGAGGVTEFLSHPVTGIDPAFERTESRMTEWLTAIPGTADALPFEDRTFDAVLCVEVLEHLPTRSRTASLLEMVRVLEQGGRLILTFPSGATARRLDVALNDAHRRRTGADHPWIVEHIEQGVPEGEQVAAELRELLGGHAQVALYPQAWAPAWWLTHMTLTAGRFRPLGLPFRLKACATLLFRCLRHLNFMPAYRAIVVVDKKAVA